MINFFRNIRRQLANDNKYKKYFRYAFGEILLVVIGILIALQVNNWNERRKQDLQFKVTVEQLHASIISDIGTFYALINYRNFQIEKIDSILMDNNHLTPEKVIAYLYTLSWDINNFYISDSKFNAENLNYNLEDSLQNEIAKIAIRYVNSINTKIQFSNDRISSFLLENEISFPKFKLDNPIISYDMSDTTYYSKTEISNLFNLMKTNRFITLLKSIKTEKEHVKDRLQERIDFARYLSGILENYEPSLKIIYEDVGIIGTSINGWDKSTPMVQTDQVNNIWEIDLYLKKGEVKFRCNDSWNIYWASIFFPKGYGLLYDYGNIPVTKAGNYHVIFKPVTGEYEFIKQDD